MADATRAVAARALARVLKGQSLSACLETALNSVPEDDRALLQQLCYGTLREAPRLQALIDGLLEKPLRRKDTDVLALLMVGVHQLDSLRIPDHAAVAATVDAAVELRKPWAKGLTNGVLRRYLRERDARVKALDPAARAAHPAWLYGKLAKQWPEHADRIVEANNQAPPMTLRVNTRRTDRESYLATLRDAGIDAQPGQYAPEAIRLASALDVGQLPGFGEGAVSVQDESAQLAAHLLDAQPGDRVLDACAAPGGKSCHILEREPALGALVAADLDQQRLDRVGDNLSRLGLQAALVCADATAWPEQFPAEDFDRILIDAPCSATGVIRRHPDIKMLRRPEDLAIFAEQQLQILMASWRLLKIGGSLLYATCSVFKEENAQVIDRFCAQVSDARPEPLAAAGTVQLGPAVQTLPDPDGGDGLYYARLRRYS